MQAIRYLRWKPPYSLLHYVASLCLNYKDDHVKTLLEAFGCPLAIREIPDALMERDFPARQDPQTSSEWLPWWCSG